MPKHFSAPSCWCAKSSAECGVVIVQLQRLRWEGSALEEPEGDGLQGRMRRSHTRRFRGKFARLQTKPSLASHYVYTGFIYSVGTKIQTQIMTLVNTVETGQAMCYHR